MTHRNAPYLSPFTLFLTVLLYFTVNTHLSGQEDYRVEEDGRFVQILRWQAEKNVLCYEVEIEKQNGLIWEKTLSGEVETDFFEVSLVPGIYRYRVRVYDLLGRQGTAADWIQFQVHLAKQPEIVRFSPQAFYLDEGGLSRVLNISGRNLTEGIEVSLQKQGMQEGGIRPETVIVERSEEGLQAFFNVEHLNEGHYTIYAVNPGGLNTSLGTFRIAFSKAAIDFYVSAGYRPLVPLYGLINELFETDIFPLGSYGRLSLIFSKRKWGSLGVELEPSWNYFHAKNDSYGYKVQAHMFGGTLTGVYQQWFSSRKMGLSFRIGSGLYPIMDYYFTYNTGKTEPTAILVPLVSTGVSFQWFIRKPFFVEAGGNYIHMFTVDDPSPGYLLPFIGAGWHF
ncbi:MAG: hypothetical protein LBP76_03735 [Treponema sp.]|jgi:hypothetical protein|nr:hypothetical protein [Treponema sp.]